MKLTPFGAYSSVSTSLQFTSDSGTGSLGASHEAGRRRESDLDMVLRTSPVRFLSSVARQTDEGGLQRLEQNREERGHEDDGIIDLEPLPTSIQGRERTSVDVFDRTTSNEPLLR